MSSEEKRDVNVDYNSSIDDENRLGPAPTEEELQTLPKVADSLSWSAWLVAVVELCERFTYYGISGPFQNYMQYPLHGDGAIKGGLGLGQQAATGLSYFFQFWCYVTPLLGAWIADQYVGKYIAICIFAGIYVCGNIILTCTAIPSALENGAGMGGLVTAMIVIGLGTGGIKSNVGPMIADQYTNTKAYVRTEKNGKRVIVDPAVTVETIFLIFYFCINLGSMSNIATTYLEKDVGFWAAYLLPTAFFFVGIVTLVLGRNKYIKRPPQGSIVPDAFRICIIACKNKFDLSAAKPSVRQERGLSTVAWSDLFVDEVRRALIGCKVFIFYPIFWLVYGQMINNFVSQAGQMDLHGIPNDIMQSVDSFAILCFVPLVTRVLYPSLRKLGIKLRPITKIAIGLFLMSLAMVYAAILQKEIYKRGPCYETVGSDECPGPNEIHVAIQTPAYCFIAFGEIFASVTGLEYAYTKAPTRMKSFIMGIFLLTNAGGSALGIALSSVSVNPKILWMYVGLAAATFVASILFYIIFSPLNKIEDELNVIDAEYTAELNEKLKSELHGDNKHSEA